MERSEDIGRPRPAKNLSSAEPPSAPPPPVLTLPDDGGPGLWRGGTAAPAKVNLSLRVLGRRPDGYHELFGLMAKIGLADRVELSWTFEAGKEPSWERPGEPARPPEEGAPAGPRAGDTLEVVDELGPPFRGVLGADAGFRGPENLVMRALAAFRTATGFPGAPVAARVTKRVPPGAGLGGGSSDAAAVLLTLNALLAEFWSRRRGGDGGGGPGRVSSSGVSRPLDRRALLALGAALGSDVPFFLDGAGRLLAGGRGELLAPYAGSVPGSALLLFNPGFPLPTARVFGFSSFPVLTTGPGSSNSLFAQFAGGPRGLRPEFGRNDLEPAALGLAPSLGRVRETLSRLAPAPLCLGLSGSGPTYWALFGDWSGAAGALASTADSAWPSSRWWAAACRLL